MTNRERVACALRGQKPDRVPFTAYEWMWGKENTDVLKRLVEGGFALTRHYETCHRRVEGVTYEEQKFERDGHNWVRTIMKTPVGTLDHLRMDGWTQEYFVKQPADYKVFEWIARNTQLVADYDGFRAEEEKLGEQGLLVVSAHRTPIQEIMVEKVGIQRFCCDLADEVEEMLACHEAMVEVCFREYEIIAKGPGEFVKLWENFTDEAFGPERFLRFHMPVYRKAADLMHAAGKRIMAHTDGWLSRVAYLIPQTGLDALESLTPPSEGDVPPEQWVRLWPNLAYWTNVPVSWYGEPPKKLANRVRDLIRRIGRTSGLALEISEDLPRNWQESVPVVLDVLEETAG
jgi:hypothetical protein